MTVDLHQVTLSEALRSVEIVADLEVDWQSWGAGLRVQESIFAPVRPVEVRVAL